MNNVPEQWFDCPICEGQGHTVHRITVYEAGCGFPHDDSDERQCLKCNGVGGWIGDVTPDHELKRQL